MSYNCPDSDVDDTPVEYDLRCTACGNVWRVKGIMEDLGELIDNGDGTFEPVGGECFACVTAPPSRAAAIRARGAKP